MKLKDFLGKPSKNNKTNQTTTYFKDKALKESKLSEEDLLEMKVDTKLNKLLFNN